MLEPIFDELEISAIVPTKFDKSWLDKNSDPIVLCNIIQGQLPLNSLQRVVVEEVLSHAISNKGCQCQDKGKQLLLYVRKEGRVRKSRIIEAIQLGFGLLKKRSKLLIAASTRASAADIGGVTIHRALSIDGRVKNKKQRIVKKPW